MNENYVFIFEFVSGGGFNQVDIPSSLFCEGFGMLRSIIADFKALDFNISTILDYRIYFLSNLLEVDVIHKVEAKENYLNIFKNQVRNCKYIFIIAPESSNILYELTEIAKNYKKIILSVDLEGIKLGTSKILTYSFFKKNKLNTPKTYLISIKNKKLDLEFIIQKFKEFKCPIIIKPEDGVGAESIYYFGSENQIREFFQGLDNRFEYNRPYILQEFIDGRDLSISLIGNSSNLKSQITFLSINSQDVEITNLKTKSEYFGGYTPLEDQEEILIYLSEIFNKINLSKFTGYYGIDFIQKKNRILHFLEINPRLTTSYIGLRNVIDINPVELIINSKLNSMTPVKLKYHSHSNFSRVELIYTGSKSINEIKESLLPKLLIMISELVTPPISFNESKFFSCFLATKTKDFKSSIKRLNDIFNTLKKFDFKVLKSRLIK
ncbi:MAG: ATP-grasp domain-containing protein [Candidatus Hodarchaeota archaeon]